MSEKQAEGKQGHTVNAISEVPEAENQLLSAVGNILGHDDAAGKETWAAMNETQTEGKQRRTVNDRYSGS